MWRADSFEKTLMLGKIEGRRRRGQQMMRWLYGGTNSMDLSLGNSKSWWWTGRPGVLPSMGSQRVGHDWLTELNWTKASVWKWKSLICVWLFVTPWTIQSVEFFSPEYRSGQPFPSQGDLPNLEIKPMSPALQVDSLPAKPQEKPNNTGVGSLYLLQWIFLTKELNQGLLHWRLILYQLCYPGRHLYNSTTKK